MNKYQEAYEYLLGLLELEDDIKWPLVNQSMKAIKELVDKATPKKTIKEPIIRDKYRQYKNYCPVCKQELLILGDYCLHCGQKVDWSD
jgi:hypothetical protein